MIYKKLILSLAILLIVIGCKGRTSGGPSVILDVHKGTDGLVMGFLENAPPPEAYENGAIPVYVQLANKGAFDISDAYLALGYEKNYMAVHSWQSDELISQKSDDSVMFNLKGRSSTNIEGDSGIASLKLKAKRIEEQSEKHESTVLMTACYKYRTEAEETVCIDTDIYNLKKRDKACEVKDLSLRSQGAPVAVNSIEVKMLPHLDENKIKPQFIIYAGNVGNGEVVKGDSIEKACSSSPLDFEDYNRIAVSAFLSDKRLDCDLTSESKTGYMRLKDKEDYIRCVLEEGISEEEGAYSTTLKVVLDYGYTHSISKEVIIKKILTH